MKKIAIILPDLRGGGAERLHVYLANDWIERGYAVELILMRARGGLLPLLSNKIKITDLGIDRIRHVVRKVSRHLKQSRPDITLSAMWPLTSATVMAWLLSGSKGCLFLSDHNQLSVSCIRELNISPLFLTRLMRLTYPFATGVIAVSKGVKEDLQHLGSLSDSQVRVIYNPAAIGVSPHREALDVREQLWGTGFSCHILSVGTLIAQKDHETLIKAFALLCENFNAKLIILGEGPHREKLQKLADELGLYEKVSMPGFVTDPYPWFRSAELFVLSSRWEGFGNVIVEALECGVPVVSTNCLSGPAEILENGLYGRLVPVGDADALAAAMNASLQENHDRQSLINRAKDFSVESISKQYLDYFGLPHHV